jgi:hypothetical protein
MVIDFSSAKIVLVQGVQHRAFILNCPDMPTPIAQLVLRPAFVVSDHPFA